MFEQDEFPEISFASFADAPLQSLLDWERSDHRALLDRVAALVEDDADTLVAGFEGGGPAIDLPTHHVTTRRWAQT